MARTDLWGPEMYHPPLGRSNFVVGLVSSYDMSCGLILHSYLVEVPSYDMSCRLILQTEPYGRASISDIDINPSSMGPIFGA